jgi:hypothetical protein
MRTPRGPSILRTAHGNAAEGGAELVAETPALKDLATPDASRTGEGLALRKARGRPFQIGNTAASGRGPSLTRIAVDGAALDPASPEAAQRARRKAASLAAKRRRELEVQLGGPVSSGVKVEIVAWARATAWAEVYDLAGDPVTAEAFAEKASAHGLKALGIGEREAKAREDVGDLDLAAKRAAFQRRLAEGSAEQ